MTDIDHHLGLEILDDATCWELAASQPVGRLALVVDGRPEIFPMNYARCHGELVMRTEVGTKLAAAAGGPAVFEIDSVDDRFRFGWSVIVHGTLSEITEPYQVACVELAGLQAWADGRRPHWLRLTPERVSGRRIVHGPSQFTD